jgi:hypothetical protein
MKTRHFLRFQPHFPTPSNCLLSPQRLPFRHVAEHLFFMDSMSFIGNLHDYDAAAIDTLEVGTTRQSDWRWISARLHRGQRRA